MLKITSKYNTKTGNCAVKSDCKNTCTYEHIYAIACLIENIQKNDPTTDYDEIIYILNELFKPKEEKKNGKRNSKSKTKI